MTSRKQEQAARRQSRYRDRRRRDIQVFPVELSYSDLDWMIETGLISERESQNRQSVAKVIADVVAELQLAEK